jgi:hypothetical protein
MGVSGRVRRRLGQFVGSVLLAALALGTALAHAEPLSERASPVTGLTPPVNTRWAGYVLTAPAVSFRRVTGSWTEPKVSCEQGAQPALSTVWVGLGGYTSPSSVLDQVGTDANCRANGTAMYFAWFELLPDVAHRIPGRVAPGDSMNGSVSLVKPNLVIVKLENLTRRWTFVRRINFGLPDGSSAEWVVEAPYSCLRFECHQAALANFGSVSIEHVSAVGNARSGTLSTAAWTRTLLQLTPCTSSLPSSSAQAPASPPAIAIPQPVSDDGTSFAISWARAKGGSACPQGTVGGTPDHTVG